MEHNLQCIRYLFFFLYLCCLVQLPRSKDLGFVTLNLACCYVFIQYQEKEVLWLKRSEVFTLATLWEHYTLARLSTHQISVLRMQSKFTWAGQQPHIPEILLHLVCSSTGHWRKDCLSLKPIFKNGAAHSLVHLRLVMGREH